MMSIIFYLLFLTPFCFFNSFVLVQYSYFFFIIYLYVFNYDFFFSNLSYFFGFDSFSYWLVLLTIYIFCLMHLCMMILPTKSLSFYFIINYFLMIFLFVVFLSLNYLIMYLFFEFSLIPLFVIIVGWGYQPERLLSSIYLLFYTVFSSLPLFLFLVYIFTSFGSLFFDYYYGLNFSIIIHFVMVLGFMVKLPLFMFHFWLPKAHVYSPIFGSMILAAILLKVGGYGLIRFMFLYDFIFMNYSYIWYSLAIYGSFFVSFICLIQGDMKCLIAYSSVAHMSFSLLGLLSMTKSGMAGCYFMMIGHGLCSSGLFCLSNMGYDRFHSRSFYLSKGLMSFMPSLSLFWFIFCCFNMSCPPSLNFLSEVYILISMVNYWFYSFLYFFFISFFSAYFSFYLFSYSNHGYFHNSYSFSLINLREYMLCFMHLIPICFLLFIVDLFF